jgi:hypothetical protein
MRGARLSDTGRIFNTMAARGGATGERGPPIVQGGAEPHVITVDERSLHNGDLRELVGGLDIEGYKRLAESRAQAPGPV